MGEVNTRRSPPKSILRTFQSCKADNNSSLRHEEVKSRSWGFSALANKNVIKLYIKLIVLAIFVCLVLLATG